MRHDSRIARSRNTTAEGSARTTADRNDRTLPSKSVVEPVVHETYLPFTAKSLLDHFVLAEGWGKNQDRYTQRWVERVADAADKDPAYLARDETLWTAGALVAVHRSENPKKIWRALLVKGFGEFPPVGAGASWDDLMAGDDLELYFEVGLRSPAAYREWLSSNLRTRHPLVEQRDVSATRALALEGRTHLDALLLAPSTGFAVHFEAKVLSDIDTKTTHDALRNQLARNLDCLWNADAIPSLPKRDRDLSVLLLLTPELFRERPTSRLYGHLFHLYRRDASALHRDLPYLSLRDCEELSRRLGWVTFEQIHGLEPRACQWLNAS